MRIIIHGGMHKTGTTSLQRLLSSNRQLLRTHGVYYPEGEHHGAQLNVKQLNWTPENCRSALGAAETLDCKILIMSTEVVSTLSAAQFRTLLCSLGGAEVTFVFCFRSWEDFLPSRWAQNCARRDTQSFEEYRTAVTDPSLRHVDCYFDQVMDNAVSAGDCNVVAVSYNNAPATPDGVLGSILDAAQLPAELVKALLLVPMSRIHARLDWKKTEAARLLNGILADRKGLPQDDLCISLGLHRPVGVFFDLIRNLESVSFHLVEQLEEVLEWHRTDIVVGPIPCTKYVTNSFLDTHAHRLTNLVHGRLFDGAKSTSLTYADMCWQQLERQHRPLVDAIMSELPISHLRSHKPQIL